MYIILLLLGILYWQMLCQYMSLYANCDMQYVMFQTQCILLLRLMLLPLVIWQML